MSKVIVVFGATGKQGSSVCQALKKDKQYKVRAATRNPAADIAKPLKKIAHEVIKADLDDTDSLVNALAGAYGCYGVTNFWEGQCQDKEATQGKALVDACKEAGVQHLVYSGLESACTLSDIPVPHFDGKGVVEEYLKESEVPYTITRFAFYTENLLETMPPVKVADKKFAINIPMGDKPLNVINVKEAGECIHQIFNRKEEYLGKTVGLASDCLTVADMASYIAKKLKVTVQDGQVSVDDYKAKGTPCCEELGCMFQFFMTDQCQRSVEQTRTLHPKIMNFEKWVGENKSALKKLLK